MNTFYDAQNDYRNYLKHYGVKGMKWRKHKNKDLKDRGYESAEGQKEYYLDLDKKLLTQRYVNEATGNLQKARKKAKLRSSEKARAKKFVGKRARLMAIYNGAHARGMSTDYARYEMKERRKRGK